MKKYKKCNYHPSSRLPEMLLKSIRSILSEALQKNKKQGIPTKVKPFQMQLSRNTKVLKTKDKKSTNIITLSKKKH
jgi:hypothetical protein